MDAMIADAYAAAADIYDIAPIMPYAPPSHSQCFDAAGEMAHAAYMAGYAAASYGGRARYSYAIHMAARASRAAGYAYRDAPTPLDAGDAAMDAAADCIRRAWMSGYRAGCYAMGDAIGRWYSAMMDDDAYRAGIIARAESWMMGDDGWAKYWPS